MIGYVNGKVIYVDDESVTISISTSETDEIGYDLKFRDASSFFDVYSPKYAAGRIIVASLWVWSVLTERGASLYGFFSPADKVAAKLISKTPKVGPALASRLVQPHGTDYIKSLVRAGDAKAMAKTCSGLGEQKAKAIIQGLQRSFPKTLEAHDGEPEHPMTSRLAETLAGIGVDVDRKVVSQVIEEAAEKSLPMSQCLELYFRATKRSRK